MSDQLAITIYQSIHDDNKPRVFEHSHASSISECPRSHYFKRQGVPPINVPTAAKMIRWKAGHVIEEVLRPHLQKIYPGLLSNQRLTSEALDLTGEYDNYSEAEKMLIEIKSVHIYAPRHLEKEGPYLSHEYQNHAYKLLLDEIDLPVEKITYIYVTLDGRILTFTVPIKDQLLNNVKKRLDILKNASDDNIPECLCVDTHPLWLSTMQYCDYQSPEGCCSLAHYEKFKKEQHEKATT